MKEYHKPYWSNVLENIIILSALLLYILSPAAPYVDSLPFVIKLPLILIVVFGFFNTLGWIFAKIFSDKHDDEGNGGFMTLMAIGIIATMFVPMNSWIAWSWLIWILASFYYYYVPLNIYNYAYNKFKSRNGS